MVMVGPSGSRSVNLFVLRWHPDADWGHLAVVTGQGKPTFLGFISLESDLVAGFTGEFSVCAGGMREVWFTDARLTAQATG